MPKKKKLKVGGYWVTFFLGVTFAYFVWLVWDKLTEIIGNSWYVLGITGTIVLFGILTGHLTWKALAEKFR